MSDERTERTEIREETKVEDLSLETIAEEEQANVKAGGTSIGSTLDSIAKAAQAAAQKVG